MTITPRTAEKFHVEMWPAVLRVAVSIRQAGWVERTPPPATDTDLRSVLQTTLEAYYMGGRRGGAGFSGLLSEGEKVTGAFPRQPRGSLAPSCARISMTANERRPVHPGASLAESASCLAGTYRRRPCMHTCM